MDNISFKHQSLKLPVKELSGTLLFNHSDIALSNVQGFYGSSDLLLNGLFKNLFANVLFDNEPLGIEANLKSEFIDLNELLKNADSSDTEAYLFMLSP